MLPLKAGGLGHQLQQLHLRHVQFLAVPTGVPVAAAVMCLIVPAVLRLLCCCAMQCTLLQVLQSSLLVAGRHHDGAAGCVQGYLVGFARVVQVGYGPGEAARGVHTDTSWLRPDIKQQHALVREAVRLLK